MSSMANILGMENWNLFLLLQTFKLWMCTRTTSNSTSLDFTTQKFLHTQLSGAPKKCLQSGPALAKGGPAPALLLLRRLRLLPQ